jgi:hypothetical protein
LPSFRTFHIRAARISNFDAAFTTRSLPSGSGPQRRI